MKNKVLFYIVVATLAVTSLLISAKIATAASELQPTKEGMSGTEALDKMAEYEQKGRVDEAVKIGEEFLKTHPDQPNVMTKMAGIYENMGKLPEAEKLLKQALEINNTFLLPNVTLARVYRKMYEKDWKKETFDLAVKAIENARAIAPNDPVVKEEESKIYSSKKP